MADIKNLAKELWGKRAEHLPIFGFDPNREITAEELAYLQQQRSYAQILNPAAMGEYTEINIIRIKSGWIVLDYGNAMTTSPGELIFTDAQYMRGENGNLERICTGLGTRIKQIIDTAAEMVTIAKEKEGWEQIQIISGEELMSWAIWKAGQDLEVEILGYTPSKEEMKKYERIKEKCPALIIHPTPGEILKK